MASTGPEITWEVLSPSCPVRSEPHFDAQVLGRKRQGQRVACSEITVDGWLKLSGERGWIISDMQGLQGLGAMLEPKQGQDIMLGIDEPQPQGVCCLEVTFTQVAVRAFPSRDAVALYYRRKGELVFVRSQNFDGWVRLAGEDGWMLTSAQDHGMLLQPRDGKATEHIDLWALSDVWAAMRRKRRMLSPADVKSMKEAEEGTLLMTEMDYEHHVKTGNADPLVDDGLISKDDLRKPESWIRQRLFANSLLRCAKEEPPLNEFCSDLRLTPRPPPMDHFEKAKLAETETPDSFDSDRRDDRFGSSQAGGRSAAGGYGGGSRAGGKPNISSGGGVAGMGGLGSLLGDARGDSRSEKSRASASGRFGKNVPGGKPKGRGPNSDGYGSHGGGKGRGMGKGMGRGMGGMTGMGGMGGMPGMQGMGPDDEIMVSTLEIDGETFYVTQDGFVLDPETQTPVGMFNPETNEVEELDEEMLAAMGLGQMAMVELNGRPYIFMNGLLIDPQTQAIAYQVEPDGTLVDPMTGEMCGSMQMSDGSVVLEQPSEAKADKAGTASVFGFEDENLDAHGWADRAKELMSDDYYYQAAAAFGEALKCCEEERAVELEFECELLRGRASCWRKMREFKSLLEDAEKLLSYDSDDAEAKEWKELAAAELGTAFGRRR